VARSAAVKVIKRGLGTLILDQGSSHSGGDVIEAGELIVRHASGLGTGVVEVKAGAKVTLDVHDAIAFIGGLTMTAGGLIDFGFGRVTIPSGGYSLSAVVGLLRSGCDDGWTGASGLATRNAQSITGGGLGYVVNDDGSLICGFAASGDTNLDGMVDILDISSMLASGRFNTNDAASWSEGDFNYDHTVDILDISDMLGASLFNLGPYTPAPLPQSLSQATASDLSPVESAFIAFGVGSTGSASTPIKKRRPPT
jgi:autotransporter-associated beta strand protein